MKQLQDAYIVAATRTPIGRSHRGFFRNTRPDDLLATALRSALAQVPNLDPRPSRTSSAAARFPRRSRA
jgi:acetyl-CoA acyltransferase